MTEATHGGDWAAYEREYGHAPLDFSANISPLGVPDGVREALREAARHADCYPDPRCRALRAAIAEAEDISPEHVLCGNGASDLIYRAVWAAKPRRALVTAPSFGEYEAALETVACAVERYPLNSDFQLDGGVLRAIAGGTDIIFLCQPNNPSGVSIPPALLHAVLERCDRTGTRVVLDECFVNFLDEPSLLSVVSSLKKYPNLLILKAFTKSYGMAGARLGYALCAEGAFLASMRRAGPPWAVSSLAQAAGLAALREKSYVNQLRALIRAERPWLFGQLTKLGLRVIPGEANFLLFQSGVPLAEALKKRGILLRGCSDFAGLDESWYRAAVRTHEDNARLISALKEVLT